MEIPKRTATVFCVRPAAAATAADAAANGAGAAVAVALQPCTLLYGVHTHTQTHIYSTPFSLPPLLFPFAAADLCDIITTQGMRDGITRRSTATLRLSFSLSASAALGSTQCI